MFTQCVSVSFLFKRTHRCEWFGVLELWARSLHVCETASDCTSVHDLFFFFPLSTVCPFVYIGVCFCVFPLFPCRWVSLVYQVTLGANCLSLGALRWAALIVLWPGTRCSYWCFLLPHSLALFLCFSSTKLNGTIILAEMIWCYKKLHDCWILLLLGWADMRKCTWENLWELIISVLLYIFL